MLLRASGALTGAAVDVRAVRDAAVAGRSGVAHADLLLAFADALVGEEDAALARARGSVARTLGPEALVDAAAVASNFERMVRIADATGIPLDGPVAVLGDDLRAPLGLERFASAANTPPPAALRRLVGSVVRPLVHGALRLRGRVRRHLDTNRRRTL